MQNAAVDNSRDATFGTGLLTALELYNNMFVCEIDDCRLGLMDCSVQHAL